MSSSFRRRRCRQEEEEVGGLSSDRGGCNNSQWNNSSTKSRSFRRYVGCKPWTGGLTLTSTGLREWDQMLCNGGQPLQTCMIIEEDRWTCDLALSFTRYWAAEAISQNQILMIVAMREDDDNHTIRNNPNPSSSFTEDDDFLDSLDDDDDDDDMIGGLSPLDCEEFVNQRLPLNLHWDKEERRRMQQLKSFHEEEEKMEDDFRHVPISTTAIMEEEEEEDNNRNQEDDDYEDEDQDTMGQMKEGGGDDGLVNAWQYKLSIQQERLGLKQVTSNHSSTNSSQSSNNNVYCHSYDLSSNMKSKQQSFLDDKRIRIVNCAIHKTKNSNSNVKRKYPHCNHPKNASLMEAAIHFYRSCLQHIQQELEQSTTTTTTSKQPSILQDVIRLLIPNAIVPILSIALPLLLSYIRQHDLPVVILMTTRPWLLLSSSSSNVNYLQLLHRLADAVLSCQSFASNTSTVPSEFSNLMGLLFVPKMSLPTSYLQANRFGLKRNRRKMEITMLHLPPEEFGGGSGLRSTGNNNHNHHQSSFPKQGYTTTNNKNSNLSTDTTTKRNDTTASLLDF